MLPHLLTNFEIKNCYQNKPEFNGNYSINNLFKMKDGTYIINLDEYESIASHWMELYMNAENLMYCDSFKVEYIPKAIRNFIGNKNMIKNIYRIQAYIAILCRYFCTEFIDFMLKGESLPV